MAITPPLDPNPQPVDGYRQDPVTPLENQTPQQAYTKKKAIFRASQFNASVIEWSTVIAMIVYSVDQALLKVRALNP